MAILTATIKAALRIDYSADDAELDRLRDAAVAWVERYCGFALSSASRTQYLAAWKDVAFMVQPVTALTSVAYTDPDGNAATLTIGTDCYWDRSGELSILRFLDEPPAMKEGTLATVTYTGGYSTEPLEVVQAVISIVGAWYNNPEANAPTALTPVPLGAQFLLEHLRLKAPFS
jgi:uncharacterized phiE125 gp8 family phage protein